jgi:hypothetical protein
LFAKKGLQISGNETKKLVKLENNLPYFPAYKTHHEFFVRNFRKNYDECILILVIYWKKTGLLQESKPFTSSDARSHDSEANFTVSR